MESTSSALDCQFVQLGGSNVRCLDVGQGVPLILIHGFPETLQGWRKNIPELAKQYHVLAFDFVGFGGSEKVEWDYSSKGLANFVALFMDHFGIEKAHVVGTDTGATIALSFAAHYPTRVQKMVILSGTAYPKSVSAWDVKLMVAPVLGDVGFHLIWKWGLWFAMRRGFADPKNFEKKAAAEYFDCLSTFRARQIALKFFRVLEKTAEAPLDALRKKAPPTLILWGRDEKFFYPWVPERLKQDLSGSRLVYIPNAGHFLQEEQPDQFNEHVLHFLDGTS